MRDVTIARNYAEAMYELAERHDEVEAYEAAFGELDRALVVDPRVRMFLETPKIDGERKAAVLRAAFEGGVPERFLRFVLLVLRNHRQRLYAEIGAEYRRILEETAGRAHVDVTLAREPDEGFEREIAGDLSRLLGKEVVPHVRVNPAILGGIIVRHGDRVIDGSLRRQLVSLRRNMMKAGLPKASAAGSDER